MHRFLSLSFAALLVACIVVASSGGATQAEARWVIADLGTLGGPSSDASDINGRGQVIGWAETKARAKDESPIRHGFLWENGKMIDLGTFGGPHSGAGDINERGQVVGSADTKAIRRWRFGVPEYIDHAFLWQDGKMTDLGTPAESRESGASAINERGQVVGGSGWRYGLPLLWEDGRLRSLGSLGGVKGWANDINERGEIVGSSGTGTVPHAFLWRRGKMIDLGTLPGHRRSTAREINDHGQVIGGAWRWGSTNGPERAFFWQSGKMRDLGTLGGKWSEAFAINARGQVIGFSETKDGSEHAFLWEGGKMRDLGTLGGHSWAWGINSQAQVVGFSVRGIDPDPSCPGPLMTRAFVWENGKMVALGTLPGGKWSEAFAINDRGQIVGRSQTKGCAWHAVLWTLKR